MSGRFLLIKFSLFEYNPIHPVMAMQTQNLSRNILNILTRKSEKMFHKNELILRIIPKFLIGLLAHPGLYQFVEQTTSMLFFNSKIQYIYL